MTLSQLCPQHHQLLNCHPPPINKIEVRESRTILSQLTSSYSIHPTGYLSRINDTILDQCNLCHSLNHTTQHLFNCSANPTPHTRRPLDGPDHHTCMAYDGLRVSDRQYVWRASHRASQREAGHFFRLS
ncbi:hypothetical protein HELRODRAFT_181979 [Helobdella robusta]|uniref:Uncharacterized protein n=1 Tax=Helobdella robusta TaxID=6412 RepID=T1FHK3_HELRO|nr:hypothetical protein HELRODRAFT_181979 [Helobdella robusta]ESN91924.1 hypothetical protein HELRODRAFT_181979 [Helobdella robusta]